MSTVGKICMSEVIMLFYEPAADVRVVMRDIPMKTVYRGIWSDGTVYRQLVQYRGLPSAGMISAVYTFLSVAQLIFLHYKIS